MGKRNRDAGREKRDDKKAEAEQIRAAQEALAAVPPTVMVAFTLGFQAARGEHPAIGDPLLDLSFVIPNGKVVLRLPVNAWDALEDEAHRAIADTGPQESDETARRAQAAGVHLPAGVDLAEEAEAMAKLKGDG